MVMAALILRTFEDLRWVSRMRVRVSDHLITHVNNSRHNVFGIRCQERLTGNLRSADVA